MNTPKRKARMTNMNERMNASDDMNGRLHRHARWIALASLVAMTVLTAGCYFPEDWRRDRRHRDRDHDHDHHSSWNSAPRRA
jgi:hypothetical protein